MVLLLYSSSVPGPLHLLHEIYGMTTFLETIHHDFCDFVPLSFRFHILSSNTTSFLNLFRGNDQWPGANLFAYKPTISAFAEHASSLSLFLQLTAVNIDMKIIRPWKCSGSQSKVFRYSWISRRISSVVCPGNIFHSNSSGSPSIPYNSLYCCECALKTMIVDLPMPVRVWILSHLSNARY